MNYTLRLVQSSRGVAAYVTAAVELICPAVFSRCCACVLGVLVSRSALISHFLMKDATPSRRRFQMSWPTFSTLRPGCKLDPSPLNPLPSLRSFSAFFFFLRAALSVKSVAAATTAAFWDGGCEMTVLLCRLRCPLLN